MQEHYPKFEDWLLNVIKKEKPKPDIIGYNLAIEQTKVGYSMYLMGSRIFDAEDSDWACSVHYYPADRYFDFPKDAVKDKSCEEIEEAVIGYAKKFSQCDEYKNSFLGKAKGFTAGFDDGDLHII